MKDTTGDSRRQEIEDSNTSGSGGVNGTTANAAKIEEKKPPDSSSRGRTFSLAQMLVDTGILQSEEVAKARQTAWEERQPLGRVLVRDGLVLSRDLATLTALNLGLPMVDLRNQTIEPEAVGLIPEGTARKNMVLGLTRTDGHLVVAMTDPTDLQLLQDLATRTGYAIDPVISTQEDIQEHADLSYRLSPTSGVRNQG